jgi:hypothetical protein
MYAGIELGTSVPTFQQGSDYALGFPICLGAADLGEPLIDVGVQAGLHTCMRSGRPGPCFALICVPVLDGIGAFFLDLVQKGRGGQLGCIRQDGSEELARIVIDGDKEIFGALL